MPGRLRLCDKNPDGCNCPARGVNPEHGTHSTYTNHGCRCDECRAANVEFNASARLRRWEEMQCGVVSPPHGQESTYFNYMCRCDLCRAEHVRRDRERRARRRARVGAQ